MTAAAIRAVFAEWRMIKTRKVLALVFEVPLEQQAEVLTMLGAPMPDAEIWCGIAKLVPPNVSSSERTALNTDINKQNAKDRFAVLSPGEKAVARAGMLPQDLRFQAWVKAEFNWRATEDDAVEFIRQRCCDGLSRSRIATEPECMDRFIAMETEFKIAVGELPEMR